MSTEQRKRDSAYKFFIAKENKLRALMLVCKIILPKQPSSYEPHTVIRAHIHSWSLKGMERLKTLPALTVISFPREYGSPATPDIRID